MLFYTQLAPNQLISARWPGAALAAMCTFPAMTQERDACPRPITRAGVPASWYPGIAARRARMRVLAAMTTPGRFRATLDVKDRHHHRRVRDVADTDHQAAPDGQRTPARAGGAGRR